MATFSFLKTWDIAISGSGNIETLVRILDKFEANWCNDCCIVSS